MTDFVQFLYTQYIQSYIDAMPMDAADEYHHDLVKNECTPDLWTDIEAIRAFAAAHAFLLGLRTGRGWLHTGGCRHPPLHAHRRDRHSHPPAVHTPVRGGRGQAPPLRPGLCGHPCL